MVCALGICGISQGRVRANQQLVCGFTKWLERDRFFGRLDGQQYFAVSYILRPDLTAQPEISTNLSTWGAASLVEFSRVPQPDGTERVIMRELTPQATIPRHYLRIRLTKS